MTSKTVKESCPFTSSTDNNELKTKKTFAPNTPSQTSRIVVVVNDSDSDWDYATAEVPSEVLKASIARRLKSNAR
jgi:hypothetical protein